MRSFEKSARRGTRSAFTLVEMIGVLAIIAILAVVIVPRVFSTIASSRVTNAVASINASKSAVTEFAARYGTVPTTNGRSRLDDLLFTTGMLEGPFRVKIGTQSGNPPAAATWAESGGTWTSTGGANQNRESRLICLTSNTNPPSTSNGRNFRLNGTADLPSGARVISAVLVNITAGEARELSARIDGDAGTAPDTATADDAGKVAYRAPNRRGLTTAYVYIAHQ